MLHDVETFDQLLLRYEYGCDVSAWNAMKTLFTKTTRLKRNHIQYTINVQTHHVSIGGVVKTTQMNKPTTFPSVGSLKQHKCTNPPRFHRWGRFRHMMQNAQRQSLSKTTKDRKPCDRKHIVSFVKTNREKDACVTRVTRAELTNQHPPRSQGWPVHWYSSVSRCVSRSVPSP